MKIQDKVIIITGASGGIGLALAHELSKRGGKVVLAARSKEKIDELSKAISGSIAIQTDVTKQEDIKNLIAETEAKFGRVDVLVNNAGRGLYAAVEKVDIKEYKNIMELNVFSVFNAMQEVIPLMRKQGGGFIMNISSMVSKNYYPSLGAYASTKYALNALSLTSRTELAKDNIIVSVFHPKMTDTDFGKNALRSEATPVIASIGMDIDTAELVAEKIADQIESEVAEVMM